MCSYQRKALSNDMGCGGKLRYVYWPKFSVQGVNVVCRIDFAK